MQDQCRASGEVHAEPREDYGVQPAGRQWRSRRYSAVCGGCCAAVLRLADCEADMPWQGPRRGDEQDAARAEPVRRARDSYIDSAAPADFCGCGVPVGTVRYEIYGAVSGAREGALSNTLLQEVTCVSAWVVLELSEALVAELLIEGKRLEGEGVEPDA